MPYWDVIRNLETQQPFGMQEFAGPTGVQLVSGQGLDHLTVVQGVAIEPIIVTVAAEDFDALVALAAEHASPLTRLGVVGGDRLSLGGALDVAIDDLRPSWRDGLRVALGASDAEAVAESFAAD